MPAIESVNDVWMNARKPSMRGFGRWRFDGFNTLGRGFGNGGGWEDFFCSVK